MCAPGGSGWLFVFSLSKNGDQLSQWRAYTSGGNGYSVGFDVAKLEDFARASKFHLSECHYVKEDQERLVREIPSKAAEEYERQLEEGAQEPVARGSAMDVFRGKPGRSLPRDETRI